MKITPLRLKKEDFLLEENTPGVLSRVASYEVPRGHALAITNDFPALLKILAKETFNVQITSDPFEITLSHVPAPCDVPSQQGHAEAGGNRYEIVEIDPQNKKLKISGPTTASAVELVVYYAIGEGSYKFVIEKPRGSSVEREAVLSGSLYELNSRDIYDKEAAMVMPELLLVEEWELQLMVDTPASIDLGAEEAILQLPAVLMDEEGLEVVLKELGVI